MIRTSDVNSTSYIVRNNADAGESNPAEVLNTSHAADARVRTLPSVPEGQGDVLST